MDTKLRPSGIEGVGDVDWGNHFCLFYETKEDLLNILIPYFKAGLENNEFFLCIASPPLSTEEARQAMREALPNFEQYLAEGQIEIVPYQDWLLTGGRLDAQRVLQNWTAKLNWALAKGYAGLRFAGDPSWLDKQTWGGVPEFEKQLDQIVSNSQMLGLCVYALERCSMADVLHVVQHHQFTVVKTNGFWERLEGSELKRAHDKIRQLNADLEGRVAERTAELAAANEQLRMKITERERAEKALRESEEKFSAAFRASPIALVIATLDGKYVEMNQAFCELLGYSREELLGKTAVDIGIFNAETREEWAKAVKRAGGVITNVEFNFRLQNGISRTTLFSVETIAFHGIPHRLTTILDITERKRSEQALQESEQRYHTLVDQIPAIVYIDDVSKYPGITMFVNSYIKTALGFTPEEWINGGYDLWSNCIHPEDRLQVLSEYQACMQSGQPFEREYRMIARDGRLVWLQDRSTLWTDEKGHPLSMHGIAYDITEHKRAEEELKTQKEILQKIFDHTPMMIGMIGADGQWRMVNRAWEHTIGWTLEELQQPNFDVLAEVYPDPQEYQRVIDFIAAKSGKWEEFKARTRDGRALDIMFTNIYLSDGTTLGFGLDITERKQAEEAIRKSEQVLREAESLGHTGSWEQNLVTGEIFNTEENLRLFFGDDRSKGDDFEDYAQVVHLDDREYVMQRRAELLEEEGPSDIEYRVVWPDGSVHVIFGRASVVLNELGQPIRVYGTNVDITERKQAEEEIRRHAARMEALAEISQALAEVGLDVQAVFETVVRHSAELIGDTCSIRLLSSDEQWLQSVHFHNPNPEVKALMRLLHPIAPTSANHSWLTPVLQTGQPLLIPVITQEQFRRNVQAEYLPFFEQVGLHSLLVVPLRVKDRVIGTLGLSRDRPGNPYTPDDLVLLQNLADRTSLTIQNAQLFEQIQGAHQRLQVLSSRLAETQESERRQLALELHDEFGQSLTALKMDLAWLHDHLPPRSKGLHEKVDSALDLTNEAIQMTQRLASQLRPRMLDDLGLAAAIEWHVNEWSKHTRIKTKVNLPEEEWQLSPSLNTALYRVCQEALTNVARHAGASKVEVSLAREGDEVVLTVRDHGRGIDRAKITAPESLGLLGMKERVEQSGGKLEIQSAAGKGSTVVARVPISQPLKLSQPIPKVKGQARKKPKVKGSRRKKA